VSLGVRGEKMLNTTVLYNTKGLLVWYCCSECACTNWSCQWNSMEIYLRCL